MYQRSLLGDCCVVNIDFRRHREEEKGKLVTCCAALYLLLSPLSRPAMDALT